MKFALMTLALCMLVSCSGNDSELKKSEKTHSEASTYEEGVKLDVPQVGFHRSLELNYHFQSVYENMTLNPAAKNPAPGVRPFFLILNDDNHFDLTFYRNQYLKKVSYLDLGNALVKAKVKNFDLSIMKHPHLKSVKNFGDNFTFMGSVDYPEQDMGGKVFIVETEAVEDSHKAHMTIMFWVECQGDLKWHNKTNYTCSSDKLNFNYKLLNFRLERLID